MKPKRLVPLDFAKSLSIIFMIFVHVYEVGMNSGALQIHGSVELFFQDLIEFTGGILSAGVFVFIMGFLIGNSASKTREKLLKEAWKLFLLGLLVNVFQQWVPVLFRGNIVRDFIENAPAILATDIYFFDAMCMLCLALVFCFKEKMRIYVAVCMIIIAGILAVLIGTSTSSTGNVWIDTVLGVFVRINEWSYFPLFNWLIFPFTGYILGYIFRTKDYFKKVFIGCIVFGVIAIATEMIYMDQNGIPNSVKFGSEFTQGDYYALTTSNKILGLGIIFTFLFICYVIVKKCFCMNIPKVMSYMSNNVSDVYVIQWMLIGLLTYPLERISNIYVNILFALLIMVTTLLLTKLKKQLTAKPQTE